MTEPTNPGAQKEIQYTADVTQSISCNAYLDIQLDDGEVVKVQLTARHGQTAQKIYADFLAFSEALEAIRKSFPRPSLPTASAPKTDPAAALLEADGNKQAAAEIKAQAEAVPPSRKGRPYKTFDASIVEVLPQPDGKTTISFYGEGRKYPDCKINKWKVEQANGLMKHITSEPMDKAAKYSLACRVYSPMGHSTQSRTAQLETIRTWSMSDRSSLCLPDEICQRFTALAETVGQTHRAIGRVVDEYVSELSHGMVMQAYELFADLYYRTTGEQVSARTIRAWRDSVTAYSKPELREFETLTDAQLVEAVKLSEIANLPAADICRWAVANAVDSVPQMRAHWLQPPDGYHADECPGILSLVRSAKRYQFDTDPEFIAWLETGRALIRRLMAA